MKTECNNTIILTPSATQVLALQAEVILKRQGVNLGTIASELLTIYLGHEEAAPLDAGFDGGEFSGPWHAEEIERQQRETIEKYGLTREQFYALVVVRTSPRAAFFEYYYL